MKLQGKVAIITGSSQEIGKAIAMLFAREGATVIVNGTDLALAELPNMQREICRWRRIWPNEKARTILALRSLQMSRRTLELSGLLIQTASEQKRRPGNTSALNPLPISARTNPKKF